MRIYLLSNSLKSVGRRCHELDWQTLPKKRERSLFCLLALSNFQACRRSRFGVSPNILARFCDYWSYLCHRCFSLLHLISNAGSCHRYLEPNDCAAPKFLFFLARDPCGTQAARHDLATAISCTSKMDDTRKSCFALIICGWRDLLGSIMLVCFLFLFVCDFCLCWFELGSNRPKIEMMEET